MTELAYPKVLTAHDMRVGHPVFLTAEGWGTDIRRAMVAVSPEQADELAALGARLVVQNRVADPHLIEVSLKSGIPVPVSVRKPPRVILSSGEVVDTAA